MKGTPNMSTGPSNIPPGYDPKCLMCNLRRKPGCIFCYAPGNSIACAEHRTPCGKHSVVEAPAVFESEESPPPKQAPQSHDEKPERRAWSLPKTADGDTLLMLPTDRDIPPGLLNEKRWLIWKAEWDSSGKFKKPPRSPFTGQKIGATEKYLSDFGTFAEARAAAEKFNSSGLGFVFLRGDKRVAIDFDHCIKTIAEEHDVPGGHVKSNSPAINREVWPWLDQWFANTYQEVSPSGDGSHVICLGELPGGKAVTATELPKSNGTH